MTTYLLGAFFNDPAYTINCNLNEKSKFTLKKISLIKNKVIFLNTNENLDWALNQLI